MLNKYSFLIKALFLFLPLTANAAIVSTYSIASNTVSELEKQIDYNTIIFIDLDNVVVRPESKMFNYYHNQNHNFINSLIDLSKQNSNYLPIIAKWYQQRKVKLFEAEWAEFINNLRDKKFQVFGFCSMPLPLKNIEQKRTSELELLNIRFTPQVNFNKLPTDNLLLAEVNGWQSLFYRGVIFSGSFSKEETIKNFLKKTLLNPKKIIFFSANAAEMLKIQKTLERSMIDFTGVVYLKSKEKQEKPNQKLVEFQQKTLLTQGKWLEDDEAENLLNDQSPASK